MTAPLPPLHPPASTTVAIVLAIFASTGAAGCAGTEERGADIAVDWTVDPAPAAIGTTQVAVVLADSLGRPLEDADVVFEGTMTHPGMQPVLAAARESSPGRYEAALDLTMAGDWVLLLEATLPDGTTIHRRHELLGVRAR